MMQKPDSVERYGRILFDIGFSERRGVSYTKFTMKNGQEMFSPWIKDKDKFGGDTYINETHTIYNDEPIPRVFPVSLYGKFIRERNSTYPVWFGYFDTHMHANKEWRQNGMKQIIEYAEWERIMTPELKRQIQNIKFGKIKA